MTHDHYEVHEQRHIETQELLAGDHREDLQRSLEEDQPFEELDLEREYERELDDLGPSLFDSDYEPNPA